MAVNKVCNLIEHFGDKVDSSLRGVVGSRDVLDGNFALIDNEESYGVDGDTCTAAATEKLNIVP